MIHFEPENTENFVREFLATVIVVTKFNCFVSKIMLLQWKTVEFLVSRQHSEAKMKKKI